MAINKKIVGLIAALVVAIGGVVCLGLRDCGCKSAAPPAVVPSVATQLPPATPVTQPPVAVPAQTAQLPAQTPCAEEKKPKIKKTASPQHKTASKKIKTHKVSELPAKVATVVTPPVKAAAPAQAVPQASPPTPASVAATSSGCVEIRFTTKPGDSFVRIPIHASGDSDVVKDACTGIKRPGDTDFGPWMNDVCPRIPAWVCDFSRNEKIVGRRVVLMGSYTTKPGMHIVRLPGYFAKRPYLAGFALIRGDDSYPALADHPTFLQAEEYGVKRRDWLVNHSTDTVGVRQFDYSPAGVATIRYAIEDAKVGEADLYFPPYGAYDASTASK